MTTSPHSLPSPRVLVDRPRLQRNIAHMQALATSAGVLLRPHAKTHKSIVVARWQVEAGAVGICCAKLGEAEVFAEGGIADIRLPYPINPSNADRVAALQDQARLSIVVDDLEVARAWSREMRTRNRRLDVLTKIDVGFHRCGFDPDAADVVDRLVTIAALPGLAFRGLLSHAGHAYAATSASEIEGIAANESATLARLAAALQARGVDVPEVSVGSTPTARCIGQQAGITEMRPGNYVVFDRSAVGLGAASLDECAMTVMATVVSRPAPTRLILDAGSKTLTSDAARGFGGAPGYGLVFPALDTMMPDASIVIERLSEEHAVCRVPADCALQVGDRVLVLPNHTCPVANLADDLLLVEDGEVVDTLIVDARGRNR